jgi:hypothetical protein
MLIREALDLVYSLGFTLTGLVPCFMDAHVLVECCRQTASSSVRTIDWNCFAKPFTTSNRRRSTSGLSRALRSKIVQTKRYTPTQPLLT